MSAPANGPEGPADPAPRQHRGPGRLIARYLALLLVLSGTGILGYVAWEYYGTDIIAKHRQAEIRQDLRAQWDHATADNTPGPETVTASTGTAVALVRIPRFGSDYEVPLIEGVGDDDLSRGIGHFPGAGPGQIGNFALAAHRVTHGEPFRHLPDMRPGDEVIIETATATYTYVLDTNPNDLVVPFTEGWVVDPVPIPLEGEEPPGMPSQTSSTPSRALITLTTCSELFHTDDRMVAFGHLVSSKPKE